MPEQPDDDLATTTDLHDTLDNALDEAGAPWRDLAIEMAWALTETEPGHPLLKTPEVERLLRIKFHRRRPPG